jgi:hypothetical protein
VTHKLLVIDEVAQTVSIVGWTSEWGKTTSSGASRQAKYKASKQAKSQEVTKGDVTSVTRPSAVTPGDASDATEQSRAEHNNKRESAPRTPPARKPKKQSGEAPDDWDPRHVASNAEANHKALTRGIDLARELEAIRNYAAATGKTYVDWNAAWRGWIGRSTNTNGQRGFQRAQPDRPSLPMGEL